MIRLDSIIEKLLSDFCIHTLYNNIYSVGNVAGIPLVRFSRHKIKRSLMLMPPVPMSRKYTFLYHDNWSICIQG